MHLFFLSLAKKVKWNVHTNFQSSSTSQTQNYQSVTTYMKTNKLKTAQNS